MPPRPRVDPTVDWQQIARLVREPGQRSYELIRPVVLFGQLPAERAAETGLTARTVYRQVVRFNQLGLAGLVPPPRLEPHRALPPEVRQAIRDTKREHPPLTVHELARICWVRFGHRPSPRTVKRVLARTPSHDMGAYLGRIGGRVHDPVGCSSVVSAKSCAWRSAACRRCRARYGAKR